MKINPGVYKQAQKQLGGANFACIAIDRVAGGIHSELFNDFFKPNDDRLHWTFSDSGDDVDASYNIGKPLGILTRQIALDLMYHIAKDLIKEKKKRK